MSPPYFGDFMEFVKFVFSSFWTFSGFFFFAIIAYAILKAAFDFVVELIHGKPTIINNPEKIIEVPKKKTREPTEKIDSSVKIDSADVSIIKRK